MYLIQKNNETVKVCDKLEEAKLWLVRMQGLRLAGGYSACFNGDTLDIVSPLGDSLNYTIVLSA